MKRKENMSVVELLADRKWSEFARTRFAGRTPSLREKIARETFNLHTRKLFKELDRLAKQSRCKLNYELGDLQRTILDACELPCRFCQSEMTLQNWAVSYSMPLRTIGLPNYHAFTSLIISCHRCAIARGDLAPYTWSKILQTLKKHSPEHQQDFINAIVTGALIKAAAGRTSRVLPGPGGTQVTREAHTRASQRRKK